MFFNLFRSLFQKQSTTNPLEGKALRYMIGAEIPKIYRDGIIEVGYDINYKINDNDIAYCNLFDEENSGKYGPYLRDSDTAKEYDEGQIDPNGAGWEQNLRDQFTRRKDSGFHFIELDNPDAYDTSSVLRAVDRAGKYGLKVIAKNPGICADPIEYIRHPNVYGIIVEDGCGIPQQMADLRKKAGKPTLPVWFVFFGSRINNAEAAAHDIREYGFKGMGVTYSPVGEYVSVEDIKKP